MKQHETSKQTSSSAEQPLQGQQFEALYVREALHPTKPLDLPEGSRLHLQVEAVEAPAPIAPALLRHTRWRMLILSLVALSLAGLAQQQFLTVREWDWTAVGMAVVAALLLAGAFWRQPIWLLRAGPPPEQRQAELIPQPVAWRAGWIAAAIMLMLLVLVALGYDRISQPRPQLNWTFIPWMLSIGCLFAAVGGWQLPRLARPPAKVLLLGLALTLLTTVLRLWNVGHLPPTLGGDEGSQGLEAVAVLEGRINNPFTTGWLGVPTMSFYFNAPTIALFGQNATSLRLPWAIIGALTVLVSYFLVARLYGRGLALLSTALLAGYHYHIHYSRLGSNQIADGLFAALTLLFLYRGYDRRTQIDWALCGLVIGVSQFFYAGARFTIILSGAVLLLLLLRDGRSFWRQHGWGVVTLLAVAILTAAPMIQYAFRFPDDYNARINAVGIFQNGWIEREQELTGSSQLTILFQQFQRAALAYNAYPDRIAWYGLPDPLFDWAYGTLFLLGIGFAGTRLFDRRIFPLVAWWGGAILMGGMLTDTAPSSQRLITTSIPAIVFVALGLVLVAQGLGSFLGPLRQRVLVPTLTLITLGLMATSIHYYFIDYTPRRIYGNPNAVVATELAYHANAAFEPNTRVLFLGWPRMSINFGSFPYLAPHVERVDILEPISAPPAPDMRSPIYPTLFVILPEREHELAYIRETFPNGTIEVVASPLEERMLYMIYRLP